MSATLALAKVTIAEAVRSRVAIGLAALLGAAQVALAATTQMGDGTETGRASAYLASSLDVTWGLLAVVAVLLATTSLSRELEDGRAIAIAVTPVPRLQVLLGKWLGLVLVLATLLGFALAGSALRVELIRRTAPPAEQSRLDREVLVARASASPPRIETEAGPLEPEFLAPGGRVPESKRARARAWRRVRALEDKNELPPGMSEREALGKVLKEEVVSALSVGPKRTIAWTVGPIAPLPDEEAKAAPMSLRYRYRVLGTLPPGKGGPAGVFGIEVPGKGLVERRVDSKADSVHELPIAEELGLLRRPRLVTPVDGKVTRIETTADGQTFVSLDGVSYGVPPGFKLEVSPGQAVKAESVLATAREIWLRVSYQNLETTGIVVVFPPEGVQILHVERSFAGNVGAAGLVLLGRLAFLAAVGLALSTFLDGKVAAFATFGILGIAAAHGFLDEAVGPIVASQGDEVFGALDAPVKAFLRGILLALPDLGRFDPGEALAAGRSVEGAAQSVLGLAALSGGIVLALGGLVLSRRELEGRRP